MEVISVSQAREENLKRSLSAARILNKKCFCCPVEFESKCFGPLDGTSTIVVADNADISEIESVCKLNRKGKK